MTTYKISKEHNISLNISWNKKVTYDKICKQTIVIIEAKIKQK
jgi:hypothetical protein